MSKKHRKHDNSGTPAAKPEGGNRTSNGWLTVVRAFADLVAKIVDRFGWPGGFIILAFFFVQYNGTAEQKQRIIDKFVLGKELDSVYPLLVVGAVGVLIFLAQNYYWRKKVGELNGEIKRLSKWKSEHQQQTIGVNLHHTETKPPPA